MNASIRKFLLINLLIAIALTTTLTAIGNYYLDQKDLGRYLDKLLVHYAISTQAFIRHEVSFQTNLDALQASLNKAPKISTLLNEDLEEQGFAELRDNIELQIWSQTGKLLLVSPGAPSQPLSERSTTGFSDTNIRQERWRSFTLHDAKTNYDVVVAGRYDIRDKLARNITINDINILLLTFPLSGLLIWFIIGKGLSSLTRIAQEVSHRAPNYLNAVNLQAIPLEIKPVIEELNKLLARLQQALEREQRFAADAAHELKTPLAALRTQAQVALQAHEGKAREAALEKLIKSVDRSSHIVQQLLTLSRLVPGATHIEGLTAVNLTKLTTELVAQLVPTALEKNIDIELNACQSNVIIIANNTALSILIRNLVDNAIRYTPEDGCVEVIIEEEEDHVIFAVRDTGPGIPQELRTRVFERFFRVLGNKSPGSGLGLAIVQKIAKLHRATVELRTPPNGKGLEIRVKFNKIL